MKLRKLYAVSGILFLFSCAQAKSGNGLALLPLLMGGTETPAATAAVTPEASGNSFTVVSLDSATTANAVEVAPPTSTTSTSTTTTTTPSTSGNESSITTVVTTTTTTPVPPSGSGFNYESNINTTINVSVSTPSGPVVNAPVVITENTTTNEQNVVGSGQTNNQGNASIPVSVPPTVANVNINITGQNPITGEGIVLTGQAPTQQPTPPASGSGGSSTGTVAVSPTVNVNTNNFQAPQGCLRDIDSDCDGIPNYIDEFPDDASLVYTTKSGRYTITFEDQFPRVGDGDLNDFVLVFSTEMDVTPTFKVKTIRGLVTLIGKSSGGAHEMRLGIKSSGGARISQRFIEGGLKSSGNWSTERPWSGCSAAPKFLRNQRQDCISNGVITKAELEAGILVMPSSRVTLYGSDHRDYLNKLPYRRGVTTEFEIVLDNPEDLIATKNIVNGHLDWFMVQGTNVRVRRAGFETETRVCNNVSAVRDRFVDCNGFPFSVIIPGVFNFQIDGANIQNANTTGYARFATWASSGGTVDRDWYNFVTKASQVVDVRTAYEKQPFTAYLISNFKSNPEWYALFLISVGAGLGFFFKRKF